VAVNSGNYCRSLFIAVQNAGEGQRELINSDSEICSMWSGGFSSTPGEGHCLFPSFLRLPTQAGFLMEVITAVREDGGDFFSYIL
jgi:hypothetical protein